MTWPSISELAARGIFAALNEQRARDIYRLRAECLARWPGHEGVYRLYGVWK